MNFVLPCADVAILETILLLRYSVYWVGGLYNVILEILYLHQSNIVLLAIFSYHHSYAKTTLTLTSILKSWHC